MSGIFKRSCAVIIRRAACKLCRLMCLYLSIPTSSFLLSPPPLASALPPYPGPYSLLLSMSIINILTSQVKFYHSIKLFSTLQYKCPPPFPEPLNQNCLYLSHVSFSVVTLH